MGSTFRPAGAYVLRIWRFYKHFAPLGLVPSTIGVYFSSSWIFVWNLKKNQKHFENAH